MRADEPRFVREQYATEGGWPRAPRSGAGEFDAVVAAWRLYHVPDLDRGLSEIARVLRPGGALVAVTNSASDLHEVWDLVGRDLEDRLLTFRTENGEHHLGRHFESDTGRA